MDVLPVVYICDENYALPTAVSITSLKLTKKPEIKYHVYVMGRALSADSIARLKSMSEDGFIVDVRAVMLTESQTEAIPIRERIPQVVLLKFDLPDLFPEYEKILYLDSDTAVLRDISELFSIDLRGVYALPGTSLPLLP